MKLKCDVLNLEWSSKGRDIEIIEPILLYLEKKYHIKVIRESIWFGELKILKYRPKLLIISNSNGATVNFRIVKFAYLLGIKTVSLISEGDLPYTEENANALFWGWNNDHKCYEDLTLLWSRRSKNTMNKLVKESKEFNLKVSGGTGFDKFKFLDFLNKETFFSKYNKPKYEKVIGLAGWCFDLYYDDYRSPFTDVNNDNDVENEFFINSGKSLNNIYKQLIENNPQILFILKYHPGTINRQHSEFNDLCNYNNIIEICREENIADVINVCDLWIGFETTTCLEAWLLNKKTLLINPLGADFPRSIVSEGSTIVKTYDEARLIIDNFFNNCEFNGFDHLSYKRDEIIEQIIGNSDGKNHIRASKLIYQTFSNDCVRNLNVNIFIIKSLSRELVRYVIINTPLKYLFKKQYQNYKYLISDYDERERESVKEIYYNNLNKFYEKYGDTI